MAKKTPRLPSQRAKLSSYRCQRIWPDVIDVSGLPGVDFAVRPWIMSPCNESTITYIDGKTESTARHSIEDLRKIPII